MSTGALLGHAWRVWVPAVVLNTALQALLVAPFVTPAASVVFVVLVLAAIAGVVVSVGLIGAAFRSALGGGTRWPSWGEWLAVLLLTLAVSASALVAAWLVIPVLAVAAIMLPAVFGVPQRTAWGFGLFARAPLRGILLTLVTLALVALLWFAALMFGFFVTGCVGAALTWLVIGVIGAFVLATWFATPRRERA
ncbi:hypothetical protein IT882_09850 [Microbacterium schleiferi]|uniref:Uncharacterized protein n=1 Tax=Microbacterium schleiferi TaxID=69362 RepID=A0A7S8MV21_9MICO|nr:hypothetical protein [Microbacterium schleiferi]QPE03624.1 hypothetical protein IT882_09850 [Microbacterium schleiferi]